MRALLLAAALCMIILSSSLAVELPSEAFSPTRIAEISSFVLPSPQAVSTDKTTAMVVQVPLPPVRKPVVPRSRREICETLAKVAHNNDLPIPFFIRLLFQESRFKPGAVSPAGAQGIAQFMPETSADVGLDNPFDPLQAIPASARLLRQLFDQFGNLGLAAAAYNAGPKRVLDWLAKKAEMPAETKGYVKAITGRPADAWRTPGIRGTAHSLPARAPCRETVPVMPLPRPSRILVAAVEDTKSKPAKVAKLAKGEKATKIAKSGKGAHGAKAHPSRHKARTEQLAARRHAYDKRAHKHK